MTLELAKQIVSECMAHVWFRESLRTEPPPSLKKYSLRDLLDANSLIAGYPGNRNEESKTTTVMMHCDDRLIAALYILYHYPPSEPEDLEVIVSHAQSAIVAIKLTERPE